MENTNDLRDEISAAIEEVHSSYALDWGVDSDGFADAALRVITEHRASQRESFERAVDELIAHAIGFGTSGREGSREQTASAKRAVMQAAGYGED